MQRQFSFRNFSVNKRLDDWVPEDYLDTRKVQFPRKDGGTGQNTGAATPKRPIPNTFLNSTASRPSSPKADAENDMVNGNSVMAAAIQKKINRKRKVSFESNEWRRIRFHSLHTLNCGQNYSWFGLCFTCNRLSFMKPTDRCGAGFAINATLAIHTNSENSGR